MLITILHYQPSQTINNSSNPITNCLVNPSNLFAQLSPFRMQEAIVIPKVRSFPHLLPKRDMRVDVIDLAFACCERDMLSRRKYLRMMTLERKTSVKGMML